MDQQLKLLLVARLNTIEDILVTKLGIESKELEKRYLEEITKLQEKYIIPGSRLGEKNE